MNYSLHNLVESSEALTISTLVEPPKVVAITVVQVLGPTDQLWVFQTLNGNVTSAQSTSSVLVGDTLQRNVC